MPMIVQGLRCVYTIVDEVPFAHGRTSVCYRARSAIGEDVCLKVFTATAEVSQDGGRDEAFLTELRSLAPLRHPNILAVLDSGTASSGNLAGRYFVVLPLCEGDLRAVLSQQHFTPPAKALQILRQIAAAVDHAHTCGIIHGNIKPENILFAAQGSHALLSDFGLSHLFASNEVVVSHRSGGDSCAYLSPEQLQDGTQTIRSDIFSLAVVAYELFVGDLPVNPHDPPYRQMASKVNGELRNPSSLNPQIGKPVAESILRGLKKDSSERAASASEYCEGIACALAGRETLQVRTADDEKKEVSSVKPSDDLDTRAQRGSSYPDLLFYILKRPMLWGLLLGTLILFVMFDYWQTSPGAPVTFLGRTLFTKGGASSSESVSIQKPTQESGSDRHPAKDSSNR